MARPKQRSRVPAHDPGDLFDRKVMFSPDDITAIIAATRLPLAAPQQEKLARELNAAAFYWKYAAQADGKRRESRANEPWKEFVKVDLGGAYRTAFNREPRADPRSPAYESTIDGPFLRFASAALAVLGQQITPDALRDMLRNKKPSPRDSKK